MNRAPLSRCATSLALIGWLSLACPGVGDAAPRCDQLAGKAHALEVRAQAVLAQGGPDTIDRLRHLAGELETLRNSVARCSRDPSARSGSPGGTRTPQRPQQPLQAREETPATPGIRPGGPRDRVRAADAATLARFSMYVPASARVPPAWTATTLQSDAAFRRDLSSTPPPIDPALVPDIFGYVRGNDVFINTDKANDGTLYHEHIHYYGSKVFAWLFECYAGVKMNEGVTEYFTRQLVSASKRAGHYDLEYLYATVLAEAVGEDTLRQAYFGGEPAAMRVVREHLDGGSSCQACGGCGGS